MRRAAKTASLLIYTTEKRRTGVSPDLSPQNEALRNFKSPKPLTSSPVRMGKRFFRSMNPPFYTAVRLRVLFRSVNSN